MFKPNKQQLIYIQWQDAHSISKWIDQENLANTITEEMFVIEEIGWIVHEDKIAIHMCSRRGYWNKDFNSTPEYGQYQRIPRGWILKRINLSKYLMEKL